MIEYFKSGRFYETLVLVLFIVLVVAVGKFFDKKYLKTKSANSKWYRSTRMINDFIKAIIITILVFAILSVNGFDVGKYVKSLGVIGIIMSFALQDILKDLIMGLSIMFEGYYKVGDCVVYDGRVGKIISFNVKSTKMFMLDDESTLTVSNRNISQIAVASDWFDIDVPIGYDVDLLFSRSLCRECAKKIERLRYVYSCDFLNTQELEDSCIKYKLRVHCLTEKQRLVRRNALAVVQDVFYDHGASFPFNVLILHDGDKAPEPKKKINVDSPLTSTAGAAHKRKLDYELGRGAAKSKMCEFNGTDEAISKAIGEADRYTAAENLNSQMKLRIRLLSEELLSMIRSFARIQNGRFQIERDDTDYDLCFEADAKIDKATRDKLVKMSSEQKNEAYSGISGLLTQAIDSMILMSISDKLGENQVTMNTMQESIGKADDDYRWSYNVYKEKEQESDFAKAKEDVSVDSLMLERSVLCNLSDDIKISVRSNHVSIRVLVKSIEDED